jgi:hypothetical protein
MRFSGQLNNKHVRAQMADVVFRELCGKVSISLIDAFSVDITPRSALINVYAGKNVIPAEILLGGILHPDTSDNHPLTTIATDIDHTALEQREMGMVNVKKLVEFIEREVPRVVTSPSVEKDVDWIKAYDKAIQVVDR